MLDSATAAATVGTFVTGQEAEGKGREGGGRKYHKGFLGGKGQEPWPETL